VRNQLITACGPPSWNSNPSPWCVVRFQECWILEAAFSLKFVHTLKIIHRNIAGSLMIGNLVKVKCAGGKPVKLTFYSSSNLPQTDLILIRTYRLKKIYIDLNSQRLYSCAKSKEYIVL
jgi:hypothetical protein